MTTRYGLSQFSGHFQPLSNHAPKFPSEARSTGLYALSEAAAFMDLPADVMKNVAGGHMLPYNSLHRIRGIDIARYLVKSGRFDEVRELFELEGDNRGVAHWVHQRREDLLCFYRAEQNYHLGRNITPGILGLVQSALLGPEIRGNEKLYRTGCMGVKFLSHQPEHAASGEEICAFIIPQCPHGEQRDVYVPLDMLVENEVLISSRGELSSSVQYALR